MANPIAELIAQLGFSYDDAKLKRFKSDLQETASHIESKTGKSVGGATRKAKAEQSDFYKETISGYRKAKPKLKDHQLNLKKIRNALLHNKITTEEYRDARIRVLSAINTKEKKIHRDRIARFRREERYQPFAGGKDPRQAGDHRLISAIHSDIGLGALAGGFALAQSSRAYQELVGARQGVAAAMGGEEAGRKEMEWLIKKTNELGTSLTAAADGYKGLAAATKGSNLEGRETRRIFEAVASYSKVLNLSLDDQKGVFRSLVQMQSKGIVNAEELSQQFGERLPGAYEAAARAMGMTTPELRKATEMGEVTAEELFPKLSTELLKMANSGGQLEKALNNTNSALNRFSNNVILANARMNEAGLDKGIRNIFNTMSEAIMRATPVWETLGKLFNTIFSALEGPIEMFGMLGEKLGLAMDETGEFTNKFKILTAAIVYAVKPFRRIAAALFIMGIFIPAITDTIDEGFDSWNDFFTKMAIWAAGVALLISPLKSVAKWAGKANQAIRGGSTASKVPENIKSATRATGEASGTASRGLGKFLGPIGAATAAMQGAEAIWDTDIAKMLTNRQTNLENLLYPSIGPQALTVQEQQQTRQAIISGDVTFNINGDNSQEIADEVLRVIHQEVIRPTSINEVSQEK